MLNGIISFSIRNKIIIGILTITLIAWGIYSLKQLPIDAVPDITNNQVQIITVSPTLASPEIERFVTFPVEQTMATIPNIVEMRSISRFGLSVVTVVFDESTDQYWARQQVNERLSQAKSLIPANSGNPEIGPLSTGLSEIYQYIVRPAVGYESKYDAMELRTIQDWIVRRQLLGTPGIADISSFGGFVKQYEIALDPQKLRSMNISVNDVFYALEQNNENTGGAYIERNAYAYYIRSEGLVETLDDIRNIAIKTTDNGVPILIAQVGEVGFGNAARYGALTYNDTGEAVGGVVLMLKGENSSAVIDHVKGRIEQIKKTLPEGVELEPFLDRTKLVNNAIQTVTKNLAEGALIVVFVLVLLLGNWRAGLIVASVIPLAMLFAVSLMNLFGVSGNLMSLGAIDFGLIVDGAVIIVEATLHHMGINAAVRKLNQQEMDEEVRLSASSMMRSAAFGQVIILIVYLPILSLVGIEGKMFKPMAQTVSFAIIGALILSITYVPMISALFLSKTTGHKVTISDKIMSVFRKFYAPIIDRALRTKTIIITAAILLLAFSVWVFTTLGGEFIPSLDEGDFAVETRLLTGSSLSQSVEANLKTAEILLQSFPEVNTVVGKIGTSEIPTDPMSMEVTDLIIVLKDKDEWTSASTREELAEKMAAELKEKVPGVSFGFQQPIQLRTNELMTGAKQDVVIKVYGENLDALAQYGAQIGELAQQVPGAQDIYVEPISGLPQIVVKWNRKRLAQFGLTVEEGNRVLRSAFAGEIAGLVFENEKRFDLVVRLDKKNRKNIEDVKSVFVTANDGHQVPLDQLASIELISGPNQIQRDNAQRRIVIGFNVRGRDVESIVNDIDQLITEKIKFEPGYYTTYGGSFQNLEEAKQRLSIALPVALILIFLLLYFTFNSLRQSLLIFSAIPFSAIGGIFALWLRDMPFSISAGVGFIALFGVAVLNGIVLIAEFNSLRSSILPMNELVKTGTQTRLRPVLMTAFVASLGFLPMALSHGSGAEVQRPLATVVIGGLVTATLLTLVVLPLLYTIFEKNSKSIKS
jgi:cobalt-zinc-cadmium resistance protein CzcA